MSNKDEALRITSRFLLRASLGEQFPAKDYKLMADLCFLALPMKYRMDKQEKAELYAKVERKGE